MNENPESLNPSTHFSHETDRSIAPLEAAVPPISKEPPRWAKTVFMVSVGGFAVLTGFSSAIAFARKRDSKAFDESLFQQGGRLATRAFLYGSLWACAGVGLVSYSFYRLFGPFDGEPFRQRVGAILPEIKKKPVSERGRTEFASLTELMQYVIDEDQKKKAEKLQQQKVNSELPV